MGYTPQQVICDPLEVIRRIEGMTKARQAVLGSAPSAILAAANEQKSAAMGMQGFFDDEPDDTPETGVDARLRFDALRHAVRADDDPWWDAVEEADGFAPYKAVSTPMGYASDRHAALELLYLERAALGCFVSAHPLELFPELRMGATVSAADMKLVGLPDKKRVLLAGTLTVDEKKANRSGKGMTAFCTLSDLSGTCDIRLGGANYKRLEPILTGNLFGLFVAELSLFNGKHSLWLERYIPYREALTFERKLSAEVWWSEAEPTEFADLIAESGVNQVRLYRSDMTFVELRL